MDGGDSAAGHHRTVQLTYLRRKLEDLEQSHADSKREHAAELENLRLELARTWKTNAEQVEQIARMKRQKDAAETSLQDAKKQVHSTQLEARELRNRLRGAEQERDKVAGKHADIAELRKALSSAEAKKKLELQERDKKLTEMQRLLSREKQKSASVTTKLGEMKERAEIEARDEREQKKALDLELHRLRRRLSESEAQNLSLQEQATSSSLRHANRESHLLNLLASTAEEYGRLSSSAVSSAEYERLKFEAAGLRLRVARLERKRADSDDQVHELANLIRHTQVINKFLSDQLSDNEEELRWRASGEASRDLQHNFAEADYLSLEIDEYLLHDRIANEEELKVFCAIAESQSKHSHECCNEVLTCLVNTERHLEHEHAEGSKLQIKLKDSEAAITKLAAEHETVLMQHAELTKQDDMHIDQITALKACLESAKKDAALAQARTRTELLNRDEQVKKERELTNRLQITIQKCRMAEDALKAEIETLTRDVAEGDAYREAYQSIADEMRGLIARNILAEEETERLSRFNAEILGHRNPTQKILYVDRIRKELAETKQKLALSTRDYEAVLSENSHLRDELGLYKSVVVPVESKPKTNLTRVRRLPFAPRSTNIRISADSEQYDREGLAQYLPRVSEDMTLDDLS